MIESAGGMSPAGTPTGKTAAADLAAASARSPTKVSRLLIVLLFLRVCSSECGCM